MTGLILNVLRSILKSTECFLKNTLTLTLTYWSWLTIEVVDALHIFQFASNLPSKKIFFHFL